MKILFYKAYLAFASARNWLIAQVAFAVLAVLKKLPAEKALAFMERAAKRAGPWTSRHTLALDNLRQAYPEKSADDLEQIARDMWGHLGRLAAEYVFMDQLFVNDPERPGGARIDIVGREIFLRLQKEQGPHIFFTAHLGNFELLPVCAAGYDLDVTSLFRAPNNPHIAKAVAGEREGRMGGLLPSRAGAALTLARILENGGNVGILVDQKFRNGLKTTFFGRPCETNPLVAKLARHFECPIHPARTIRLPNGRFRLELQEALVPPRNAKGGIDDAALTQMINDIVEGWVREDPAQWFWMHRRWEISPATSRNRRANR